MRFGWPIMAALADGAPHHGHGSCLASSSAGRLALARAWAPLRLAAAAHATCLRLLSRFPRQDEVMSVGLHRLACLQCKDRSCRHSRRWATTRLWRVLLSSVAGSEIGACRLQSAGTPHALTHHATRSTCCSHVSAHPRSDIKGDRGRGVAARGRKWPSAVASVEIWNACPLCDMCLGSCRGHGHMERPGQGGYAALGLPQPARLAGGRPSR